ncbi:MAG: hypothetical protein QOI55_571, partial [Actinomycetota bacterium]|nr:hypothetical protein [Actinomycetota bacterium]
MADERLSRSTRTRGRQVWSLLVSSAITALSFVVLHHLHLLGNWPLPVLLGLLAGSSLSAQLITRRWTDAPTARQLHLFLAVQTLGVTAVIYAIGWGATLAIGYVFVGATNLEQVGSRAWRPALGWTVVGIAAGQVAVAFGAVPTYVHEPYVHGLATLSALGMSFILYLLGTKTEAQERSDAELRAGESNFRQLFADNPQPMWVYDTSTLTFLEVNAAAIAHYGYQRDEFLARRVIDLVEPGREADAEQQHRLRDGRV